MTNLAERIKELRLERGLSLRELADACETSKSAISMYERGKRRPKYETLEAIADVFNVDMEYLLGKSEVRNKAANLLGFDSLEAAYNAGCLMPSEIRPISMKRFPMLGEIACGEPIFANEDHESYIDASADIKADFCLTAKGDSMIGARIHDGDVVFIKKQPIVENGEIAAVVIDNEATLKRWYFYPDEKKLVLAAENSAFAPFVYVGSELDEITCLGKAVCFMSNL